MKRPPFLATLSRRRVLALLAAGGITAIGGTALYEYAPWIDSDEPANNVRRLLETDSRASARTNGLIRYATLAASGHNTQPWMFSSSSSVISIHPDYSRRLSVVDPHDRELWISLGCALENLLTAARAQGYSCEVTYPDTVDFIQINLAEAPRQRSPQFDAIPLRQNTRSEYDGRPISAEQLDRIREMPLEPGVHLKFIFDPVGLSVVQDFVRRGNLNQQADPLFLKELVQWLRFNKREALASCDGLYSRCMGNPPVPRWLGRLFVTDAGGRQQADADAAKLDSSAGVVIVASTPQGKAAWVRTGQVYERLALTMTSLNIKSAFLNQPIEVESLRGQFQSALALGEAVPQLLIRFGYADPMPRSFRRSVEKVFT